MTINDFTHYPRFVFNTSDNICFSTADLDELKFFTHIPDNHKIKSFCTGEIIQILWKHIKYPIKYRISKIDIRDIRYDTEEKLYGIGEGRYS